jgi:hypothetical protein
MITKPFLRKSFLDQSACCVLSEPVWKVVVLAVGHSGEHLPTRGAVAGNVEERCVTKIQVFERGEVVTVLERVKGFLRIDDAMGGG